MKIIGCDYHPSFQQIAMREVGSEQIVRKRLEHARGEAERFYRSLQGEAVKVGIEACGNTRRFECLLRELAVMFFIRLQCRVFQCDAPWFGLADARKLLSRRSFTPPEKRLRSG